MTRKTKKTKPDVTDDAPAMHVETLEKNMQAVSDEAVESFFFFQIGETWLGISAHLVDTVVEIRRPSRLPLVPAYIKGLVPYGQRAIAILHLGMFLGIATDVEGEADGGFERVLVVSSGELQVGIPVRTAAGLLHVQPSQLNVPNLISGGRCKEFLHAEVEGPSGVVGILNIEGLLEAARV